MNNVLGIGGCRMKISEVIPILECYLEKYGDCEIVRIDRIGVGVDPIEYFEFIGGSQLLCSADQPHDRVIKRIYKYHEQERNEERVKEWRRDCEGE